ncbi:MAG TPA: acyl-ACP--UDP-N-acetylglucosamine O-acyltransferase [Candidatus Kapabacteria bacterium]|jgi:UDP-N-acetylglucosamine acyltransferase|nr:acyl-ACP--UDP-N-acetylglucosamine O-acyltransferase [Candidatus Kapabacteria bacterium]
MTETLISPRAEVDPEAIIGDGVRIGPFAVIEADVEIGDGVEIFPHAHISSGARIGRDCRIFTGAAIGGVPQDLKFGGERTLAIIGERTVVREYVTIHRGTAAHGRTVVGSDCLLMAYCHVAHDCEIGDRVITANAVQLGGHVQIDDWAIIGGLTGVHQFERIGCHAMVGAGFRVMKDVPPYALAGNQPLGFSGVNVIGLQRRGFSEETIDTIRQVYRIIYQSGLNMGEGVERVALSFDNVPEVDTILEFFRASERGVIPLSR